MLRKKEGVLTSVGALSFRSA